MSGSDRFTTMLPATRCPYCDVVLDAASHMSEAIRPRPNDISVCICCAQPLRFDAFLALRKLNPGEAEALLLTDPEFAGEVARIQRAVRGIDRRGAAGAKVPV